MITVVRILNRKLGIHKTTKYANRVLPELCLELCGGYTEAQTVKAMLMRQKVESDGLYRKGPLTVTMDDRPLS